MGAVNVSKAKDSKQINAASTTEIKVQTPDTISLCSCEPETSKKIVRTSSVDFCV
jgi:hypothetical protein